MLRNRDYLEPRQGLRNDPTPGVSPTWPCRAEKILDFLVPEHQNPSKNRALRAPRTVTLTSKIIDRGALPDKGKVKPCQSDVLDN